MNKLVRLRMKFVVEYGDKVQERVLTYITEDCSFDMEPFASDYELELILNKLSLSLVDNKIIQITGFCGLGEWMKSDYEIPKYQKGALKVEHNLKYGFAYGIYDEDLPVYLNIKSGWICIGNPQKPGRAVEFIHNCVAVIANAQQLVALWLKPQSLPEL